MIETEMQDGTIIKMAGVGGADGNAVQYMINRGVQGVEFIYMNADTQVLKHSTTSRVLQLDSTGLGAGVKPEIGKYCTEEAREQIADALRGAHMVLITAGMGGGTGTGAVPAVAQVVKGIGTLTVGVVSKPFDFEGAHRPKVGEHDVNDLEGNVNPLIVVLNERFSEVVGDDAEVNKCFQYAGDALHNVVADIAGIVNVDGLADVDFEDMKTVMGEQDEAMMGTATVSDVNHACLATEQVMVSPLLKGVDLPDARGVLVSITASRSLKPSETKEMMNTIRSYVAEGATVIFGTVCNDAMGDMLRMTVAATGLGRAARNKQQQPQTMTLLKTGTNDQSVAFDGDAGHSVTTALDYSNFDAPVVWRSSCESASAHVAALQEKGADMYDISAFLCKQAD